MKIVLLVLLTVLVQDASAQDARLARRLDSATAARVSVVIDSARMQDIPAEPLVQKALEGASKGADADAIVTAVRLLAQRLVQARAVLGSVAEAELVAAAAALHAGAGARELGEIHAAGGPERTAAALVGYTFLLQRGLPSSGAAGIVKSMLDARLGDADFLMLQRLMDQDIRSGAPPGEAAQLRARALIQQRARLRRSELP